MKVLIANWIYNWGSTGYILRDLKNGLQDQGIEVCVACGVSRDDDPSVFTFSNDKERALYGKLTRLGLSRLRGSTVASKKLIRFIEQEKPDLVHLHLLHCTTINLYHLLRYLGKNHIKTILTNHAELYYTGTCGYAFNCNKFLNSECRNCDNPNEATESYLFASPHRHWKKMADSLKDFSSSTFRNTAVSPWLQDRVLRSSMMRRFACDVVMNGVDTEVYTKRGATGRVLDKLGDKLGKYTVYVSAKFDPANKNDIKGGFYIVELAKTLPKVTFVVVATDYSHTDNLPENILFWGKAATQMELAELYSNAAMTVLTSRKETFSMICAETLCCGTPVVGFLAGGPESISLPEYSSFVEYPNLEKLKEQVQLFFNKQFDRSAISEKAIATYSRKAMTDGYVASYKKLLEA